MKFTESQLESAIIELLGVEGYPPGYHLGEQALCDELKISRVPAREALRALAAQGLVDRIPNQGCFVKQLDVDETNELFEARQVIELALASLLIERGKDLTLLSNMRETWQKVLTTHELLADDTSAFIKADTEFHLGLAISRLLLKAHSRFSHRTAEGKSDHNLEASN